MAQIAKNLLLINEGAAVTKVAGAAAFEVLLDRSDNQYVFYFENGDAADCMVRFQSNGFGGDGSKVLDVDIAAGEFAAVGLAESMYYKDPSTQEIKFEILDQDGTAFSGTAANVLIVVFELPKGVTN